IGPQIGAERFRLSVARDDVRGNDALALIGGNTATPLKWQYGYDPNGNQTDVIDGQGQHVVKTYDYLDRVQTVTYADATHPAVNAVFDPQTRTVNMVTNLTLAFQMQFIEYAYDPNSNVLTATEHKLGQNGPVIEVCAYTYDALNRMRTVTNYDAKQIVYTYD